MSKHIYKHKFDVKYKNKLKAYCKKKNNYKLY